MLTTTAYLLYIVCSVCITVLVSRTLSVNGRVYLVEAFEGNEAVANSVNHMLVVGFYLLNLGFVLLRMRTGAELHRVDDLIVYLTSGLGFVLFFLGIAHFLNMYLIHKFRKHSIERSQPGGWPAASGARYKRQVDENRGVADPA